MVQITVDLSADKATLARVAQLILQFAGYEPPRAEAPAVDPVIDRGPVTHPLLGPVDRVNSDPYADAEDRGDAAGAIDFGAVAQVTHSEPDPQQAFGSLAAPVYAPPAPPAAMVPPPPPPPPPAGIDVDARGLPWDPRIHASTRAKTADGSWRQKRGTDPQEVIRVEAELRQTMSLPAPASPLAAGVGGNLTVSANLPPVGFPRPPVAPPAPPAPVVPPVPFAGNAAPPAPPVSTSAPVASPGAAPSASPGSPAPTFPQLMGAITKAFTAGTLPKATIDAAIAKVGLSALPMLASRPDLVGAVASELGIAL